MEQSPDTHCDRVSSPSLPAVLWTLGEVGKGSCDRWALRFLWHRRRFSMISLVVDALGCVPMFPLAKVGDVGIIAVHSLCDGAEHNFSLA
jgi:hypothetical protein